MLLARGGFVQLPSGLSGGKPWAGIWMEELARGDGDRPAFDFSYPEFLREMKRTGREIGLTERQLGTGQRGSLLPYQLRHSGASHDMNKRSRAAAEVQKRGRWASAKSLARYERGARLAEMWQKYSPATAAFIEAASSRLEAALWGHERHPLAPPYL